MEDIYIGSNNPRRKPEPEENGDIYFTPRNRPDDIYIGRRNVAPEEVFGDEDDYDYGFEPEEPEEPQQPERKPKKKKRAGKLVRRLRAAVLIAVLFIGIFTGFVYNTFSNVNYTETGHRKNVFLDSSDLMHSINVKNILLIGVDRRNADDTSRSDTMLMVSVNTATRKIKLTSFMRDSYVYVPEKKRNAKLNAACSWGGAQMVMDTIEYNFNIKIDYYMLVDFSMFEDIINGLGGVDVDITEKEAKYMRDIVHLKSVQAGEDIHLNGNEALWYCRIRKLDSDFMRTQRQRKVMTALIDKCKHTNPFALYGIVEDVVGRIETDMSPMNLTGFAMNGLLRYLHYDIEQGSVPAEGTWKNKTVSGQSVLSVDLGANIEYLKEFIYEK